MYKKFTITLIFFRFSHKTEILIRPSNQNDLIDLTKIELQNNSCFSSIFKILLITLTEFHKEKPNDWTQGLTRQ